MRRAGLPDRPTENLGTVAGMGAAMAVLCLPSLLYPSISYLESRSGIREARESGGRCSGAVDKIAPAGRLWITPWAAVGSAPGTAADNRERMGLWDERAPRYVVTGVRLEVRQRTEVAEVAARIGDGVAQAAVIREALDRGLRSIRAEVAEREGARAPTTGTGAVGCTRQRGRASASAPGGACRVRQ